MSRKSVVNPKMQFKAAWFVALLSLILSCEANGATYKQAAERYCELYSPNMWDPGAQDSPQEIYGFIVSEAMKIDNTEFRKDLARVEVRNFSEFHDEIHRLLESRLGQSWKCPAFDDFFYPTQTVVELSVGEVRQQHINPESNDTLIIILTEDGEVLVNNKPLTNSSPENIGRAVDLVLIGKAETSTKVYLYFDEGADGGRMFSILQLLKEKNIESVGLIGYPK